MADHDKKNPPPSLAQVNHALAIGTKAAIRDRISLRDAICDYLAAEQARGTPLRHITQTLIDVLKKADKDTTDETTQEFVDWCMKFRLSPI